MSERTDPTPRETATRYISGHTSTTYHDRAVLAASIYQGDQIGRLADALAALAAPTLPARTDAELDAVLVEALSRIEQHPYALTREAMARRIAQALRAPATSAVTL